jgi:hypothetical protein
LALPDLWGDFLLSKRSFKLKIAGKLLV